MKRAFSNLLAVLVSLAVACSSIGACYALTVNQYGKDVLLDAWEATVHPSSTGANTTAPGSAGKEETVFVLTGADGAVQSILVSDWLKNPEGLDTLSDVSELSGIENVSGDEGFTQNGANLTWNAAGNDIYYRGTTDKTPPVSLRVEYALDGAEISPADLAGRSGHVTIRYTFENLEARTVKLDGRQETLYVPFAVLTGFALDNEVFSNIQISNGKLVNDGSKTFVVGLAFPGLQEDLNLSADKLELPSAFELSADAENFSLGMSMTVVTNEPFAQLDPDKLAGNAGMEDLEDSLDQLADGMAQLLDGSSQLYDGLCTLLEKSGDLVSGVDSLADGAFQLKTGADALAEGAGELASGASELNAGAGELASGAGTLASGAGSLYTGAQELDQGAASLSSGAGTLAAGAGDLYAGMQELDQGAGSLASGASALSGGAASLYSGAQELASGLATLQGNSATLSGGALQVFNTLLATAQSQILAAGLNCPTLTVSNYADILSGLIASLDPGAVYEQAYSTVTQAVEAQRDYITQQVTAAVRAEVEAKVTAAVRAEVQAQVILSATGMDEDSYNAAVAAGMIDAETQAAIGAAIDAQMESADVQATIAALVEEQMASAELQAVIAENVEAQVQQAIADAMESPEVQSQLSAASEGAQSIIRLKTSLDSYNAFYLGLIAYTNGVASAAAGAQQLVSGAASLQSGAEELASGANALKTGADTLLSGAASLASGAGDLASGAASLHTGTGELVSGAGQLTGGAGELASGAASLQAGAGQVAGGAGSLKDGADALADGQSTLYDGTLTLQNAMPELVDGVTQLRDGAMQLSDGLQDFDEQGISKLLELAGGDLPALLDRLRAICELSAGYQSFTGLAPTTTGQVKFIFRTEGIG